MYYYPMMNGSNWGIGAFMMFVWFIFIIVMAFVIIRLVRGHEINHSHFTDPLDIAKQRYAKGEINKEQFEQLKKDLSK